MKMRIQRKRVIISICVVIVIIFAVIGLLYGYNPKMNDAQITAQDQIRTDLDKHLHEYFNNTGMSAESSDSGIISEEQMNMIISEVSSEVTPTLLKQLSLTKSEINQHAITQLEESVEDKIQDVIPEYSLSDEEMNTLIDSISLIVEMNVWEKLSQTLDQDEYQNNLDILQEAINDKFKQINLSLETYSNTVSELENKINNMKCEGVSEKELLDMEDRLMEAYRKLEEFTIKSSNTVSIINDLMTDYKTDNGVVSAKAGHDMMIRIQDLNDRFITTMNTLSQKIDNEAAALKAADKQIAAQISDNTSKLEDLNQVTDILNGSIIEVDKALRMEGSDREQAIKDAVAQINDSISSLQENNIQINSDTLNKLNVAKEQLEAALQASEEEQEQTLLAALEAADSTLKEVQTDLEQRITELSNAITTLKSNLDQQVSEIKNEIVTNSDSIKKAYENLDEAGSRIALNEEKISELSVARENLEKTAKDMEMSLNEQLNSNKSTLENEISETKSELQKEIKDQISQIPASQADNWAASWDDEHTLTFIIPRE